MPIMLYRSSGAPIYEIPKGTYSGEQLLTILLDEEIAVSRICHERPMQIEGSCTFVVDLNSLKHPDDVKKDEFGKWCYNGSHVVYYTAWKSDSNKLLFEKGGIRDAENTIELRRIHPSNPQFQRLLAFVTGKHLLTCMTLMRSVTDRGLNTYSTVNVHIYVCIHVYTCTIHACNGLTCEIISPTGTLHHLCLISYRVPAGQRCSHMVTIRA